LAVGFQERAHLLVGSVHGHAGDVDELAEEFGGGEFA
jgi:hypothetical protein